MYVFTETVFNVSAKLALLCVESTNLYVLQRTFLRNGHCFALVDHQPVRFTKNVLAKWALLCVHITSLYLSRRKFQRNGHCFVWVVPISTFYNKCLERFSEMGTAFCLGYLSECFTETVLAKWAFFVSKQWGVADFESKN